MFSSSNLNDCTLPNPLLEPTQNVLTTQLTYLLTHRNALILTLHNYFTLPLLTLLSKG